jgi:hypothetical protein
MMPNAALQQSVSRRSIADSLDKWGEGFPMRAAA